MSCVQHCGDTCGVSWCDSVFSNVGIPVVCHVFSTVGIPVVFRVFSTVGIPVVFHGVILCSTLWGYLWCFMV